MADKRQGQARIDLTGLDDTIHSRTRLMIMAFLSTSGAIDFVTLAKELAVTNGNLASHLRKLEIAGFVTLDRSIAANRTLTKVALTDEGYGSFLTYVDLLDRELGKLRGQLADR